MNDKQTPIVVELGELTRGKVVALWAYVAQLERAAKEANDQLESTHNALALATERAATARIAANRGYGAAQAIMIAHARGEKPPAEAVGAVAAVLDLVPDLADPRD